MGHDLRVQQLTPLERLQLRDALQDRWRDQVRQITLLSLARYDREGSSFDSSIDGARARLEDLEQAMHRLDNRSYGRCVRCGAPIAFTRLAKRPEETICDTCVPEAPRTRLAALTAPIARSTTTRPATASSK